MGNSFWLDLNLKCKITSKFMTIPQDSDYITHMLFASYN